MGLVPVLKTNGYLGFGKQSVFGTPVAPTAGLYCKYLSESLKNEQEDIKGQEGGSGRYIADVYKGTNKVTGEISLYARPDLLGLLMAAVLGADSFAAKVPATTPSIHTITPGTPKLLTIERGIAPSVPELVERFQDCVVNELTIEGESSQPIKVTASVIGTKGHAEIAATSPTYEANDPIMFFDTPTYKVDGGATVEISKFSIKIMNNIDTWYGTTMTPAELIEKALNIDFSFTLKFLNATHYKKIYYNSGVSIADTIASGSFQIQAGYGALDAIRSIDIELKNIKHKDGPVNLAGDASPIFQECIGYAYKPGADALITAIIKNSYDVDYDA